MAFELDNTTQTNQGSELDLDLLLMAENLCTLDIDTNDCIWFLIDFIN